MKKHSLVVATVLIVALLVMTIPAAASTPSDVAIVVHMYPNPVDPDNVLWIGTFEASGPAIDAGLVCSAGTEQDLERHLGGQPSQHIVTFSVNKLFTCNDGSGTFEVRLNGIRTLDRCTAHWVITGGDGSYTELLGNGDFSCTSLEDGTVQDTYLGQLPPR